MSREELAGEREMREPRWMNGVEGKGTEETINIGRKDNGKDVK